MKKTPESVWERIDRRGPGECWPWKGSRTTRGYGQIMIAGTRYAAHRLAYELTNGPVPDGQVIGHACHNIDPTCAGGTCEHRACCNPAHLEAVTGVENMRRSPHHNGAKTHCPKGHVYDAANTVMFRGWRLCRACHNADRARRRQAAREHRPGPAADATGCPGVSGTR